MSASENPEAPAPVRMPCPGKTKTLSLMPTWRCTAACESCGTFSTPKVQTRLPREWIISAITQAGTLDYGVVVFTGGEATLAWQDLLVGIELATSLGMLTRLVTNAHWATPKGAASKFAALRQSGLTEINFSTGDEHARFVPIDRVARAMALAIADNFTFCTMIEVHNSRTITRNTLLEHPLIQQAAAQNPNARILITESPWMPISIQPRSYPKEMTSKKSNLARFRGCDSVLTTTTLEADGSLRACCGLGMRLIPELKIGSIETTPLLEATAQSEDDFLKRWIKVQGPEHILAWAASKDPSIDWEGWYAHPCQACLRLYTDPKVRSVILRHHHEKMLDVLFAELLLSGKVNGTLA